jgi:hypothetical protein
VTDHDDDTFVELPMPIPMMACRTEAKVVLVTDSLERLMDRAFRQRGYDALLDSVRRRALVPRGSGWLMCLSFPDDPDWRECVAPSVVVEIEAQMATMREAHVLVVAIADAAELRPLPPLGD